MKKNILKTALLIALVTSTSYIMAQPGFDDDIDDVPVDGGISLLVGAATVYGIKKIKTIHKK
jgi:predicted thioesterase